MNLLGWRDNLYAVLDSDNYFTSNHYYVLTSSGEPRWLCRGQHATTDAGPTSPVPLDKYSPAKPYCAECKRLLRRYPQAAFNELLSGKEGGHG